VRLIRQHQELSHECFLLEIATSNKTEATSSGEESVAGQTKRSSSSEEKKEQLGMDAITIIWYLTTFTALIGFFVVMACTENGCGRRQLIKPPEATCPPTPCPSYKHFAPPSYDSVMKKYKTPKVFIVPVHENASSFFSQPTALSDSGNDHSAAIVTNADIEKGEVITVR